MLYKTKKTKPSHPPTLVFRATRKGYPISSILTVSFDIDPMKNQSIDMSRKPVGRFLYDGNVLNGLNHFWPMFPFYTPLKHQKTFGFLMFSGGIKWEHWLEMDYALEKLAKLLMLAFTC